MNLLETQSGNALLTGLGVVALATVTGVAGFMLGSGNVHPLDADIVELAAQENPLIESFGEDDPVVAVVNGQDIMRSEVLLALSDMAEGVDAESAQQLFPQFLDQYVNIRLLSDAALQSGVADNAQVQAEAEMATAQIYRAAFLNGQFEKAMSESNLQAMYKQMVADQPDQDEVRARHILVADEATAKKLISQAKSGADFAELAKENSTGPTGPSGGDLGYFVKGQMVAEFADAAFAMQAGDVSDVPVQTQFGWHVIKVEDRRQRVKPTFEQMKEGLAQQLRQSVTQGVVQGLRENAEITLFAFDGSAIDAAPAAEGAPATAPAGAPTTAPADETAPATTPAP